jgi:hypothetical protein
VVVRGPSCILEGALRLASARFEEGRDRWSIVREKLTHVVDLGDSPCTSEKQTRQCRLTHSHTTSTRIFRDRKGTPDQSGTTVIEALFVLTGRSDGEIWVHENCGYLNSAEHDLGKIVISEHDISGTRSRMLLKVKLDISEEGLLRRKPILEMDCGTGTQIPITWEGSNLSLSNNKRMDNVRVQLAEEMKTFHHQHNLTVDDN